MKWIFALEPSSTNLPKQPRTKHAHTHLRTHSPSLSLSLSLSLSRTHTHTHTHTNTHIHGTHTCTNTCAHTYTHITHHTQLQLRPKTLGGQFYTISQLQARTPSPSSPPAQSSTPGEGPLSAAAPSGQAPSHAPGQNRSSRKKGKGGSGRRKRSQTLEEEMHAWSSLVPALVRRLLLRMAALPPDQVSKLCLSYGLL